MRMLIAGLALATAALGADVTFSKDVLPILQKNCQACHRPGEIGPMPCSPIQTPGPGPNPSRPLC
jgi:hypothetical protein